MSVQQQQQQQQTMMMMTQQGGTSGGQFGVGTGTTGLVVTAGGSLNVGGTTMNGAQQQQNQGQSQSQQQHGRKQPIKGNHDIELLHIINDSNSANAEIISAMERSGGRRGGTPSPIPRKASPRSSPRTSPAPPHSRQSPAHCRTPSPHSHRSPRTSPLPHNIRNKSPHRSQTAIETGGIPVTKQQKPGPPLQSIGALGNGNGVNKQHQNPAGSIRSPVSAFNKPGKQSPVQMVSGRLGVARGRSVVKANPCPSSSISMNYGKDGGSLRSTKSPIMDGSSQGANGLRAASPKLISSAAVARRLASSLQALPKSGSSSSSSYLKQTQAEPTTERSNTVSPILSTSQQETDQRRDPTLRDLEFLKGGEATESDEDTDSPPYVFRNVQDVGFGNDNELPVFDKGQTESAGRDQANERGATNQNSFVNPDQQSRRSASCSFPVTAGSTSNQQRAAQTVSPAFDVAQNQRANPGKRINRDRSEEVAVQTGMDQPGPCEAIVEPAQNQQVRQPRGRPKSPMFSKYPRCRSNSWDSPRSQRRKALSNTTQRGQGEIVRDGPLASQGVDKNNIVGNNLDDEEYGAEDEEGEIRRGKLLLGTSDCREEMIAPGISLEAMAGMSLDDVFKLEKVLHSYKNQLLRQRVFSSPVETAADGKTRANRLTRTGTIQRSNSQRYTSTASMTSSSNSENQNHENDMFASNNGEGFDQDIVGDEDSRINHPPERCGSGNCFLDDAEDGILGQMDFAEDYEPTYQFQQDQSNSGVRAPNFKMFKSGGRPPSAEELAMSGGKASRDSNPSKQSSSSSAGESTISSNANGNLGIGAASNVNRLSRSPGNISFVSRVTKLANHTGAKFTHGYSPYSLIRQATRNQNAFPNASLPDPSKEIDFISSPSSAFSKATIIRPIPISSSSSPVTIPGSSTAGPSLSWSGSGGRTRGRRGG